MMENIGIIDVFIASEFFYKVLFRGKEEAFEAIAGRPKKWALLLWYLH